MRGAARPSVVAVVVTFRPDSATLERVVHAVSPQVDEVVVVDDTGPDAEGAAGFGAFVGSGGIPDARIVRLEENRGVAAAQNTGIREALALGARHVLLLDQDSECAPDMVERLLDAVELLHRRGVEVSAVGPRYRDEDGPVSGFVRFGAFRFRRVPCPADAEGPVEADFLISSGSLIPARAFERVGLMDERLFIDHVDTDWFLRARSLGLRCFGVCDATMRHALGEEQARVWVGRWRTVPRHRPFRYYYMVRNSLLLYHRSYAPRRWIAGDLFRLVGIAVFNLLLPGPRSERLRMMLRGLWHGLTGRHGSLGASS